MVESSKDVAFWRQQIDLALKVRREHEPWWEANLRAYAPRPTDSPEGYGSCINTNRDFTLVERKKADLFYQRPEVTLQPSPLLEGPIMGPNGQPLMGQPNQQGQAQPIPSSVALGAHQEIVNEHLGPDGIDATRMAHQALFDVLALSGIGFTVMGYESHTVEVERPDGAIDPETGAPQTVPVPIKETCFWHYLPPKQALIPHNFRSTEWDRAPWLGYQFKLPLTPGNRAKYHLPDDFQGSKPDGRMHFDHGLSNQEDGESVFTGVILEYRSCLFREDRPHPDHLTQLVLVDGLDEPAIEQDSPHQTIDARGQLTPDSLIGFSMHPLNMRTLTDSAYPPADATLSRPLINELNRSREQNIEFRDAATLKWMYNTDTLPADAVQKMVRSPIGGMVGVPADAFIGEGAIKELPQGSMPRENFTIADYIDSDISRTWALDAAQQGGAPSQSQTATEAQIQQGNANARLDFERGIVLQWYVKGVTKYSTLLQRYLPVQDAAKIVGGRAQAWDAWRKTVPSTLAFTAMPDSALRVDQAVDRKQAQELYSFLAQDPNVNRKALLQKLLRKFHLNPDEIVIDPPPPKPEPPKFSVAVKAENLNPFAPEYTNVYQYLTQNGVQNLVPPPVDPATAMAMQAAAQAQQEQDKQHAKHGGKVPQQESLSKHHAEQTQGMQGTGATAVMGVGGGHLQ